MKNKKVLFVITEDWALISHRLHLVDAAISSGYEVALATKINKYHDVLKIRNINIFNWNIRRGSLNPFMEIYTFLSLLKILYAFKPDIIHAVAQKPVIYAGLANKIIGNSAFVASLGGVGFIFTSDSYKARLLKPVINFFFKFALADERTRLILQNINNINIIQKNKIINKAKIRLIKGAGVEIEKFIPSKLTKETPLIMLWVI